MVRGTHPAPASQISGFYCWKSIWSQILPINAAISERAMQLVDDYALSHGMQLGNALIAATALEHDETILTSNVKHFGAVKGLPVEVFVP